MNIFDINFIYLLAFMALICSSLVITVKNPVHSIFFLVLAFLMIGALFIIFGAEYLALVLIIIYVGAIAILFLFVVMMLNIKLVEFYEHMLRYSPIGLIVFLILMFEMSMSNVYDDIFPIEYDDVYYLYAYFFDYSLRTAIPFKRPQQLFYDLDLSTVYLDWPDSLITHSNIVDLGMILSFQNPLILWCAGLVLFVPVIGIIILTQGVTKIETFYEKKR